MLTSGQRTALEKSSSAGKIAGVGTTPKVSVLIPTYNYGRFLPQAIESILSQDFADFELLICDDHSTDNTIESLDPYAGRNSRLRIEIQPANLGMVQNWNYCLAQARGKYVKFLFGDDKLERPNALGKLVDMLESHPDAALAACGRTVLDDRSSPVDIWQTFSEGRHAGREVIIRCLMEHANLIGEPSAVLFRKSDAERGFDPAYRQIVDLEFWFRLLEKGDLIYTREPLCGFRKHSLQESVRNNAAGMAWTEHLMFASAYASKSWMPKKALFPIVYEFRRSASKNSAMRTAELHAAELCVATRLGTGWYWIYWLRHRLTRPFQNLLNSLRKRQRQHGLVSPA